MYALVVRDLVTPVPSLRAGVTALLAACAADPDVTCMPYLRRADGGRLTDAEEDVVDRLLDEEG